MSMVQAQKCNWIFDSHLIREKLTHFYDEETVCESDRSNYIKFMDKTFYEEEPKLIKSKMTFQKEIKVEPKVIEFSSVPVPM